MAAVLKVYKCTNCEHFQCLGLRILLNYLYSVHSQNLKFTSKCVVPDCAVQFTKYNSLYKHVTKHHNKLYNNNNDDTAATTTAQTITVTSDDVDGPQRQLSKSPDLPLQVAQQSALAQAHNSIVLSFGKP